MPRTGVGRPRTRPDRVLADKAYTSRRNRRYLRRTNKDTARTGVPEAVDPPASTASATRNATPSNAPINRLKGFRAVATRYEKRAYIYLGTVTLAALVIWLRT